MKTNLKILIIAIISGLLILACESSREMSTARLEISNQNYPRAIEYLHKELSNNPNNEEAYILLAEVYLRDEVSDLDNALTTILKAKDIVKKPELLQALSNLEYNLWSSSFNKGIKPYNDYFASQDVSLLDKALSNFERGLKVRPRVLDFHNLKGSIYELKGDTAAAMVAYQEYVKYAQPEIKIAKEKDFYLGMERDVIRKKIGEPQKTLPGIKQGNDSMLVEYYLVNQKGLYLSYIQKEQQPFHVIGWRYDLPKNWIANETSYPFEFSISPFAALAQYYHKEGKKKEALDYTNMLLVIDANNDLAGNFQIMLYQELDMLDEAKSSFEELLKNDPNNKNNLARYADLWANLENYDKAIEFYEKAINIDEQFAVALRNLGSVLKNKAGQIQNEEYSKYENDNKYEIKVDQYMPYLERSAKYFEKALKTPEFKNDLIILGELANIYFVTEETDKLQVVKRNLEAIEFSLPEEQKEHYYLIMLKLYGDLKENEKMRNIQTKLEKYGS